MLQLPEDPSMAFGSGGTRLCFVHPEDEGLCVKVHRDRSDPERYSMTRRLRTRMAESIPWMNVSCQELRLWRDKLADPKHPLHGFFPQFHGMVSTSYGLGLVVECVRDDDGQISSSLATWFEDAEPEERKEALRQLLFLAEQVVRLALPIFDWNPQNLLVQRRGDGLHLRMIDFEGTAGNGELIRISNWLPPLRRGKVRRRIQRGIGGWLRRLGYPTDEKLWARD